MEKYETIKLGDKFGTIEHRSTNLHFKDNHQCAHKFVRRGNNVTCTKCGVGYIDDPREPFPIDEFNEFFDDPNNQEYFKTHSV